MPARQKPALGRSTESIQPIPTRWISRQANRTRNRDLLPARYSSSSSNLWNSLLFSVTSLARGERLDRQDEKSGAMKLQAATTEQDVNPHPKTKFLSRHYVCRPNDTHRGTQERNTILSLECFNKTAPQVRPDRAESSHTCERVTGSFVDRFVVRDGFKCLRGSF